MFEFNSKIPKFFIYMQLALSLIILISMFFSVTIVSCVYFVALIISAVFVILNKKYGSHLTNYKLTFFLFELINLIAIIAIMYYEYTKHSMVLNVFLILLIVVQVLMMIIYIFLIKNKNLSTNENFLFDVIILCSMICILTYFFNVSNLFFAIDAFIFEVVALAIKIYINRDSNVKKQKVDSAEQILEERIHSAGENEGEIE